MIAEDRTKDGIKKAAEVPKVNGMVAKKVVSFETLARPIAKLVAGQVSKAVKDSTVGNLRKGHMPSPPSSGLQSHASSDEDSIEGCLPKWRKRSSTISNFRRRVTKGSGSESDD